MLHFVCFMFHFRLFVFVCFFALNSFLFVSLFPFFLLTLEYLVQIQGGDIGGNCSPLSLTVYFLI